jgi:Leucine-rich repeat (LRR) protein
MASEDIIQQTETIHRSDDENTKILIKWSSVQRLEIQARLDPFEFKVRSPNYYDGIEKGFITTYCKYKHSESWDGIAITEEESLAIAKKFFENSYHIVCDVDYGYCGSIRGLLGPHTEVTDITMCLNNYKYGVLKSIISMGDCDELRNLVELSIYLDDCGDVFDVHSDNPLLCLNGIEFCSSLKVLKISDLDITNLTPLAHLELEELNVTGNPISDLSMIKTEILIIDEKQIPLVLSAFAKPSFKVKTIIVESIYTIEIFDSQPELLKTLYAIQNILSSIVPIDMKDRTKNTYEYDNVPIGKIFMNMNSQPSITLCEYEKLLRENTIINSVKTF